MRTTKRGRAVAIIFPLGLMAATLVAGPATASYEYLHVDGIGVAGGGMVVPETPHLARTGVAGGGFGIVEAETSHFAGTGIGGGAAGVAPIEDGEPALPDRVRR